MPFTIVSIEDIDTPLVKLRQRNRDVKRFSAGAILFGFRPEDPSLPYILLCQRALIGTDDNGYPKKNSWPNTWECPGGGFELQDRTLLHTMMREVYEEVGLEGWCVATRIYRTTFLHKGVPMAKYISIMSFRDKFQCQRLWSNEIQEPSGLDEKPIHLRADEHLDYCWVTEEQVQNSLPYDSNNKEQKKLVILDNNKQIFLDFFQSLKSCKLNMEHRLPELPPR
ncbi:hypothetical protein N7456_007024 [Penicillium angulare]|uniref:Nudix hydrolase domain-containing protein n=1 Tax=Penicillium angulare TaxID=116970 RepID=A0A9W9FJA2_9EURO|nr:hypothetical protein N7456_007024 [Penicillium angulare]